MFQPQNSHGRHLLAALPSPPLHPAVQPPLLLGLHAVSKAVHLPELAAVLHGAVCQDGPSLRTAQHRPTDGGAQTDGQLHHDAQAPRLCQHVQPGESSVVTASLNSRSLWFLMSFGMHSICMIHKKRQFLFSSFHFENKGEILWIKSKFWD